MPYTYCTYNTAKGHKEDSDKTQRQDFIIRALKSICYIKKEACANVS